MNFSKYPSKNRIESNYATIAREKDFIRNSKNLVVDCLNQNAAPPFLLRMFQVARRIF